MRGVDSVGPGCGAALELEVDLIPHMSEGTELRGPYWPTWELSWPSDWSQVRERGSSAWPSLQLS